MLIASSESANDELTPEFVRRAWLTLSRAGLVVLRLIDGSVWYQVARARNGFQAEWAHQLPQPHAMPGFGDALASLAVSAFLRAAPSDRAAPSAPSAETA